MSISIRIYEKLSQLPHISSEHCIGKVHDQLRRLHVEAYEPAIVAIGPYHRRKSGLQEMEQHKLRYLQKFLRRTNQSLDRVSEVVEKMEEAARKYYAGTSDLETEEFVEIMLVDGCFIIEFFLKFLTKQGFSDDPIVELDWDDPIVESDQILVRVMRDLILLENQIPFFILVELFKMTNDPSGEDNINLMATTFADYFPLNEISQDRDKVSIVGTKHLLGLLHDRSYSVFENRKYGYVLEGSIKSATELEEFGVRFRTADDNNLFDIKFRNGVLQIPSLYINHVLETLLRNLVAYEQCLPGNHRSYVCDYLVFMDYLINSLEDVQLLRRSGIIENEEADDTMVYAMLNRVDKHLVISRWETCYCEIFKDLNSHCEQRRNVLVANLRRKYFKPLKKNYFNNPWAFVSFLAAAILLLLTITQTIFSVLSVTLK